LSICIAAPAILMFCPSWSAAPRAVVEELERPSDRVRRLLHAGVQLGAFGHHHAEAAGHGHATDRCAVLADR
jgi:hypothetical protein